MQLLIMTGKPKPDWLRQAYPAAHELQKVGIDSHRIGPRHLGIIGSEHLRDCFGVPCRRSKERCFRCMLAIFLQRDHAEATSASAYAIPDADFPPCRWAFVTIRRGAASQRRHGDVTRAIVDHDPPFDSRAHELAVADRGCFIQGSMTSARAAALCPHADRRDRPHQARE